MQCLQSSAVFVVSKYHLYVISLITGKIASFTVKSFSRLHSMSRDGMSEDTRKMSHVHVILVAGVAYNTQIMGLKILANCYIFMS